jgi:imidazolonepropionase-like amidohydrolase
MLGASQLNLAAGGGVSSSYDPIDVSQYTEAEFRAAVDAAENWGTYVAVHAYTPRAIRTAIRGGVRCIEHGHLMDEATAQLIAENEIWLSMQPFLDNEFSNRMPTPEGEAKARQVYTGTDAAYRFAKEYELKTAWGTDILFDPRMTANQGAILTTLTKWYGPAEILRMATSVNGELWRYPVRATLILARSAWWRRARSPTSSSSTAIRSPVSSSSPIRRPISSSS